MRITTILFATLLITQIRTQDAGQTEGIPDPEIHVRTNEYEVSLEHLCPEAPSEEAAQCVSSYNVGQNVQKTVLHTVKDVDYTEKYGKIFQLTECSIKKVPSMQFNLQVYCYFKGVREWLLEDFKEIKSMEEFNDMMAALGDMIQNETRPDFKSYFLDVFNKLKIEHDEMLKHDEGFRTDSGIEISEELGRKINPEIYKQGNQ
jgi:hypothetical protein